MSSGPQPQPGHVWDTSGQPHAFGGWNHLKGVVARSLPTSLNQARKIQAATRALVK